MIKRGIFGGTFDPIHNGHIYIAKEALKRLQLSNIVFVPSGNPPHKTDRDITDASIRYHMVNSVVKEEEKFQISSYEMDKQGYSYTSDTLKYFNEVDKNAQWYFITGVDCLMEIESWKNVDQILDSCNFVVFNRRGYEQDEVIKQKKKIENWYNTEIIYLDIPPVDISSTYIKEYLKKDLSIEHLVHPKVLEVIMELDLYVG